MQKLVVWFPVQSLKRHPHSVFMLLLHEILHAIGFSTADFKVWVTKCYDN